MTHVRHRHKKHAHHGAAHGSRHPQHKAPTQHLGQSPTNSQKLIYIANKLGLTGIAGMQGSTVFLYDTIVINGSTTNTSLSFFSNTNGKTSTFTNFVQTGLNAGEAMILEQVMFFLVSLGSNNLSDQNNFINDIIPIGSLQDQGSNVFSGNNIVQRPGSLKAGRFGVQIANQTVIKPQTITIEQVPEYNPMTSGTAVSLLSAAGLPGVTSGTAGKNVIPLEAPPVLPPNLTLGVSYEYGPIGNLTVPAVTGVNNVGIMCVVGRFGSIFASKQTL